MTNLLKAEYIKLKKDKIILVAIILILFFAATNTIAYYMIKNFGSIDEVAMEGFPIDFSGRGIFLNSLSISNNIGLILPILLLITVCREFTFGTIRNKIITGHSKINVYLSIFISSLVTGLGLFLIHLLINLLLGSLFLGYGSEFTFTEFGFIIKTIGLGMLIYSVIIAIAVFIALIIKSTGFSILGFVVVAIGLLAISVLYMIPGFPSNLEKLFYINPVYQTSALMSMTATTTIKVTAIITSIIYLLVLSLGGSYLFKKIDLK